MNGTGAAGQPDEAELQAIVRAIRTTVDPERIVLFGSAARGQMRPDGAIAQMVVKGDCQRRATAARIYRELPRREHAVHIMVVWPEDLKLYGEAPWSAIHHALRDGREL